MKVKVKKLDENAVIATYAKPGDAGIDLTAVSKTTDKYGNIVYGTGLAFEIPEGYAGFIFPRSSVSKYDLSLCNCIGVIDSGFRGEVIFKFKPTLALGNNPFDERNDEIGTDGDPLEDTLVIIPGESPYTNPQYCNYEFRSYDVGDRIGQLIIMPVPQIELVEADELSDTERGEGGFGSTGTK